MKLIKILAEEFPLFSQFGSPSETGEEDPTGLPLGVDGEENGMDTGMDDNCQCECECPCCQSKKMNDPEDDQSLDFSATDTGLDTPPDDDDEFEFKF